MSSMLWGLAAGEKGKPKKKGRLDLRSPKLKQDLLWAIIQNAPVAYIITDKSFRVRFVNDGLFRLRRLKREEILGDICYNALNGGTPCTACVVRKAMEDGRGHRILRKDIMPDGSVVYTDDFAVPINVDGEEGLVLEVLVDRTLEMQFKEKTNAVFLEVVRSLIRLLEKKDPYTSRHCREVSAIASKLTRYMGLGNNAVYNAMLGGLLHDLGKLHVPDAVLNKNGRLVGWEIDSIREHPVFTYLVLPDLESFKTIREIAISHHEKWDGTGYPNALRGEEIPVEARIAAVADTYSAMTSDRPYRNGMGHAAAMEEIKKNAGTQFDPDIVEKFVRMVDEDSMDRDTLTAPEETTSFVRMLQTNRLIQRRLKKAAETTGGHAQGRLPDSTVREFTAHSSFADAILNATPATFTIVDESLSIIYASSGFARAHGKSVDDLCMEKCFDVIGGKATYCFEVKDGCVRCPAVRAFATGKQQYALIREVAMGKTQYHGSYAVPMTLDGVDGEPVRCCLQIIFDRTNEKLAQNELEEDLKRIADTLYNFVTELAPDTTDNIDGVSDAAVNFNDYLEKMRGELADMLASQGAD